MRAASMSCAPGDVFPLRLLEAEVVATTPQRRSFTSSWPTSNGSSVSKSASSTAANDSVANHASGELPHIKMRKKLEKHAHPASNGSSAAVRQTASKCARVEGAGGAVLICSRAKRCSETAHTQSPWKASQVACNARARRRLAYGEGPSSCSVCGGSMLFTDAWRRMAIFEEDERVGSPRVCRSSFDML